MNLGPDVRRVLLRVATASEYQRECVATLVERWPDEFEQGTSVMALRD